MTHPNTVKRLEDVLDRLESDATYGEVRETLFDIYNCLVAGDPDSRGLPVPRREIGHYAGEVAELIAAYPGQRLSLETEIGVLTLEMQRR